LSTQKVEIMYQITLNQAERAIIAANGYNLFNILWASCVHTPDVDWWSEDNITFMIPEYTVWEIYDSYMFAGWSNFDENLMCKFYDLFQIIV
jgi:hypothetical protein